MFRFHLTPSRRMDWRGVDYMRSFHLGILPWSEWIAISWSFLIRASLLYERGLTISIHSTKETWAYQIAWSATSSGHTEHRLIYQITICHEKSQWNGSICKHFNSNNVTYPLSTHMFCSLGYTYGIHVRT